MRAILRRWWSISRAIALASTTTSTHSWPSAVGRRGTITVIIVPMITSLRATLIRKKKKKEPKTSEVEMHEFNVIYSSG